VLWITGLAKEHNAPNIVTELRSDRQLKKRYGTFKPQYTREWFMFDGGNTKEIKITEIVFEDIRRNAKPCYEYLQTSTRIKLKGCIMDLIHVIRTLRLGASVARINRGAFGDRRLQ
jgi:hypothetical protein